MNTELSKIDNHYVKIKIHSLQKYLSIYRQLPQIFEKRFGKLEGLIVDI